MSRKPEIEERIRDLRSQIESLEAELKRAEEAEALLTKLDALLK